MKFFSICLEKFYNSFIQKDCFVRYSIPGWQVLLPFSTYHISFHFLGTYRVSAEKSVHSATVSLYVMIHFSCAAFKIFFVLVFWKFNIVCPGENLFMFDLFRFLCTSMIWMLIFFSRFSKFYFIISWNKSPSPLSPYHPLLLLGLS